MPSEMDQIEMENAMRNLAHLARLFFLGLTAEGFTDPHALQLTEAWLKAATSQQQ